MKVMEVTAKVQRSGDWWAIEVPEVPGVFTQAKRLDQVSDAVADAVATMLDQDPANVAVTIEPVLSAEVTEVVKAARARSATARQAADEASRTMREAVAVLRSDEHLTARDAARILGITHQRVSQLENA